MATESTDQTPAAPGRRRIITIGIAIAVGLLAGGGAGAMVAGPLLAGRSTPAADSTANAEGAAEGEHGEGKGEHGKEAAPAVIHQLDNLVLNPARSGGTRFLMVSVAFAVKDQMAVDQMKAREPELRDVVLGVLGTKTVAELTEVSARDSLKVELRDRVAPLFDKDAVRQIYFPQFVIQ